MNHLRAATHRRGISLVELTLVISVATLLMGLSTQLLQRVMRAHTRSVAFCRGEQTALRLSSQFRRDLRYAHDLAIDGARLRLVDAEGRQIEYLADGSLLKRTAQGGGQPTWQEEYALPASATARFERQTSPERAVLVVETMAPAAEQKAEQAAGQIAPPVPRESPALAMRVEVALSPQPSTTPREAAAP